jgi:biopolymer transport protein ExbB
MRIIIIVTLLLNVLSIAHADELEKAYQKEYAYLVAEKKALEDRLKGISDSQSKTLSSVNREIESLQSIYLSKQNETDRLNQLIVEASRESDYSENDKLLIETTLLQAGETLEKNDVSLDENEDYDNQLSIAFDQSVKMLKTDGMMSEENGKFFLPDGKMTEGKIVHVGRIARYGLSDEGSGALAPSGGGGFKVWDAVSGETAAAISDGSKPSDIDIFFFDNADSAIEKQDVKGLVEDIEAGGFIARVILFIGLIGALLVIVRIVLLIMFSTDIQKTTTKINDLLKTKGAESALKACKKNVSSVSRVIAATLRNIEKERDHIEDIISESILYESSKIDRFGSAILVIAAVSPLLGLLGTVTGMISTFDIITEFGTGDPKLLSSGISEALVTTKFGLVVAIPLLLLGNILTSWATRTKNGLERAALNVINTHKESASSSAV